MASTDKGKWAEGKVHDYLKELSNGKAEFDFERLPDARAAMGRFKSMIGDFEFFMPGTHGVIEAKETKHACRIAKDKLAQLPRLHKRAMCGGLCVVVVYHSSTKQWRALKATDLPIGPASWDLSGYTGYPTAVVALQQFEELS